MKSIAIIIFGAAALAVPAFAQESEETANPATQPATPAAGPVDPKLVADLMRQLGDENTKVREAATKKLLAMGQAVNPLLRAELANPKLDPEIAARIKLVLLKH